MDEDIERLEVILKLTRELGVNLAGVEIILNMRSKMEAMQSQMEELFTTLNLLARRTRPEEESRNSLIPVLRVMPVAEARGKGTGRRGGDGWNGRAAGCWCCSLQLRLIIRWRGDSGVDAVRILPGEPSRF